MHQPSPISAQAPQPQVWYLIPVLAVSPVSPVSPGPLQTAQEWSDAVSWYGPWYGLTGTPQPAFLVIIVSSHHTSIRISLACTTYGRGSGFSVLDQSTNQLSCVGVSSRILSLCLYSIGNFGMRRFPVQESLLCLLSAQSAVTDTLWHGPTHHTSTP